MNLIKTAVPTDAPARPVTFEAGARVMSQRLEVKDVRSYYADTTDPLHAAFPAKAIIHSGPQSRPLMGEEALSAYEALLDTPRTGKTLAYIHVPFCETRCLYCLFYQNPYKEEASRAFTQSLIKELQLHSDRAAQNSGLIHALYFGGGTPTALLPEDLKAILHAVHEYLPLANDCEITLEGRIHNFTDEKIEAALEGGVNRFSLGVQTFNSAVRQSVMRVDGRDALINRLLKLTSYDNAATVIDLIYGFPGQTNAIWEDDLATAISLPLDGVDCYQLNVFEKSPLARYIQTGKLPAAADTAQKADMFAASVEAMTRAQWRRLSNNHWAQTTRERNLYNQFGKSACDCLAFGSGAGGRLFGHSFMLDRMLPSWTSSVEAGNKPVGFLSQPGTHWSLLRTVSSEMESGAVNLARIGRQFGHNDLDKFVKPITEQWKEAGLLTQTGDWLVQSVAGQFWHVTLAQLLVDAIAEKLRNLELGLSALPDVARHDAMPRVAHG